jgi:hypothetical protein
MKNIAASIRAKLLNYAKKDQVPFQRVLTLYMQEGLLHRIVHPDSVKILSSREDFYFTSCRELSPDLQRILICWGQRITPPMHC